MPKAQVRYSFAVAATMLALSPLCAPHASAATSVASFEITQSAGGLTISAVDSTGAVVTSFTGTAYVSYKAADETNGSDTDSDPLTLGQLSQGSTVIQANSGAADPVTFANGVAQLSYTPSSDTDNDWTDSISVEDSTTSPTAQGSFTTVPSSSTTTSTTTITPASTVANGTVTLGVTSSIIAGPQNVTLTVVPKDASGNVVSTLGTSDFTVQSNVTGQKQPMVDSATYNASSNDYTVVLDVATAGAQTLTLSADGVQLGSTNVTVEPGQITNYMFYPNSDGTLTIAAVDACGNLETSAASVNVSFNAVDGTSTTADDNDGDTLVPGTLTSGSVSITANQQSQPVSVPLTGGKVTLSYKPTTETSSSTTVAPDNDWMDKIAASDPAGSSVTGEYQFSGQSTTSTPTNTNDGVFSGNIQNALNAPVGSGMLLLYPLTASGQPDLNGVETDVTVGSNGTFNQNLPSGGYFVFGYLDSNNKMYSLDQPINITAGQTTSQAFTESSLNIEGPQTEGVQRTIDFNLTSQTSAALPSSGTLQVNISDGGTPVSGVKLSVMNLDGTAQPITVDSSGNGSVTLSNLDGFTSANEILQAAFSNPGLYTVSCTLTDSNGAKLAAGSAQVEIYAPNVTGKIVAQDGTTPLPYDGVVLEGPNGQWDTEYADSDGNWVASLEAGDWKVTGIEAQTSTGTQEETLGTPIPFTVTTGATSTVTVTDQTANVYGTAYLDSAKTRPNQNGYIELIPASAVSLTSSTAEPIWLNTSSSGQFAAVLPAGQYTIVQEGNETGNIALNQTITVLSSGQSSTVIAPPQANASLSVVDGSGQPVTNGTLYVTSATDYANGDYSNVLGLPIDSSGKVSTYLPTGNYVAIWVSSNTSSFPVDTQLSVPASGSLTATVAPPTPLVKGTLKDSSGNPVPNAYVVVADQNDQTKTYSFSTDSNGNFNDLTWSNDGTYGDALTSGNQYDVIGVSENSGQWIPMNVPFTANAGENLPVQITGPDVTGTVTVDGTSITTGWVAFGPSSSSPSQDNPLVWAQIVNGTYSASLPAGSYKVYSVEDDTAQKYFDESQASQTSITVTDPSVSQNANISFASNFTGQVAGVTSPAVLVLSQSPLGSGNEWNNVQYVQTDSSGNFAASLAPGTWYVLYAYTDQSGIWNPVQLNQQVTVGSTPSPVSLSVVPDVTGTISWGSSTGAQNPNYAWLFVQSTSNSNAVYDAPVSMNGSTWSYAFTLPSDTYKVLGIDEENTDGTGNWVDLTSQSQSWTVNSGQPLTPPQISLNSHSGIVQIAGATPTTSGYVLFSGKATPNSYVSVPFDNTGKFTTVFDDSQYQVAGIETPANGWISATGTYSSAGWAVNAQ